MKYIWAGTGGHGDHIMATTNDRNKWYARNENGRQYYNPDFKVRPGTIHVKHPQWAAQHGGCVMFHPHIKGTFSGQNKQWPWEYWQELVLRSPYPIVQCGPPGSEFLPGAKRVVTDTFEHAVSVLAASIGLVASDGGLHHAAAALGKPACVIFGSYSPASVLGYDFHQNIEEPDPEGLGRRKTHPACIEAMRRITVERVLESMNRAFGSLLPVE